jgi:hypothetical protein
MSYADGDVSHETGRIEVAYEVTTEVTDVDPDELATVHLTIGEARILSPGTPGGLGPATAQALASVGDLTVAYRIDPLGRVRGAWAPGGDGALEGIAETLQLSGDLLQDVLQPLPAEPVGPGASWTASTSTTVAGFVAEQVRTIELVAFDGTTAELRVTLAAVTGAEATEPDAAPTDVQLDVEGATTVRVDSYLPEALTQRTEAIVTVEAPDVNGDLVPLEVHAVSSSELRRDLP